MQVLGKIAAGGALLLALLLTNVAHAQTGPRSAAATASLIYNDDFTLTHGQTVEYRTIYTTPGVDPVMPSRRAIS